MLRKAEDEKKMKRGIVSHLIRFGLSTTGLLMREKYFLLLNHYFLGFCY